MNLKIHSFSGHFPHKSNSLTGTALSGMRKIIFALIILSFRTGSAEPGLETIPLSRMQHQIDRISLMEENGERQEQINSIARNLNLHSRKKRVPVTDLIEKNQKVLGKNTLPWFFTAYGNDFDMENFLLSDRTVIFYFTADWCAQCKIIRPHLMELVNQDRNYVMREINIIDWGSESYTIMDRFARDQGHYKRFLPFVIVRRGKETLWVGSAFEFWHTTVNRENRTE